MTDSEKLDLLLSDMQIMKSDMRDMKSDMQNMKSDIQNMKSDIQNLNQKVNNIEVTLETEIRPNINIVAEAHGNLYRKLNEALKFESEKMLLLVRINTIENKIRQIKDKLAQTA